MSNKADLQRKLSEIGYEIGSFAAKDTLSNVIRLHLSVLQNKGINVAKLNDHDLRKTLTESGHAVGPVTNHTRAIYQRKLLEVLTNETSEGQEDENEIEVPTSTTPPPTRVTRNSIIQNGDNSQEPRIPLTRVDIDEKNMKNLSSYYPNLSNTKPKSEQTITNSYSPQRSSTKGESRNSNISYGLRNPYDFQNDEPMIIRHEHKATPFRTTNIPSSTRNDLSDIRSRILTTNTNVQKDIQINKDSPLKKPTFNNQLENKKSGNGTFLYGGITIAVALMVFVVYMLLVK